MANPEHLAILKQGVEEWNKWRDEYPDVRPDLTGANLSGTELIGADLHKALLPRANLSCANLGGANLQTAVLSGADLSRAELSRANLSWADLSRANLSRAHLTGANLSRTHLGGANLGTAVLSGADFSMASFIETVLANVDLRVATGLETAKHYGPSTIGIDTIYKSKGKIPEVFLRGCGVPDNFIEYMHSLAGQAFEFYSCFISYSTKDQDFADRLYADLQAKGVRCWFAPHDIQGGKTIH